MLTVANPIYDVVFKYLMEDEFFSAIEKRDTALIASVKLMLTNGVPMEKVGEITGLNATLLK